MTDKALARTLGFLTAAALAVTQAPVGFVRDEGYYFAAAQRYERERLSSTILAAV